MFMLKGRYKLVISSGPSLMKLSEAILASCCLFFCSALRRSLSILRLCLSSWMRSRLRRRGSGVLVPLASRVSSANFSFEFDRFGVEEPDPLPGRLSLDTSPEALILRSFNFLKGFRRNDIATAGGQQAGTDAV
jgi:hypothetical protein